MTTLPETRSIQIIANDALDKAYNQAARPTLEQIAALFRTRTLQMQRSLQDLDDEVRNLEENEQNIQANNPQLEQTLDIYNQNLNAAAALIAVASVAIQESGQAVAVPTVTAKVFASLSGLVIEGGGNPISPAAMNMYTDQLAKRGIGWVIPDALDFVSDYVNTPVWSKKLDGWGDGYADLTRKGIIQGIEQGWGPKKTASYIRHMAENVPVYAAENLTRTLQLTSFRDASAAMELANSDAIISKIRVAHLDERTCLTCISLHGTELQPGERVDDHYRGRCSEFYRVPGGPEFPDMMQADSQPGDRQFVPFQTGEEWFNSLPPERQQMQASFQKSPAKWRAFQDGVQLSEFVGDYEDELFGHQFIEKSLIGAIGGDAEQYYTINQPKEAEVLNDD